jgi:hypothetical protein
LREGWHPACTDNPLPPLLISAHTSRQSTRRAASSPAAAVPDWSRSAQCAVVVPPLAHNQLSALNPQLASPRNTRIDHDPRDDSPIACWRNRTELRFLTSHLVPKAVPGRWTETLASTRRLPFSISPSPDPTRRRRPCSLRTNAPASSGDLSCHISPPRLDRGVEPTSCLA